ncbi:hypothetical protein L9F63_018444, partial [Diploptera punctata]
LLMYFPLISMVLFGMLFRGVVHLFDAFRKWLLTVILNGFSNKFRRNVQFRSLSPSMYFPLISMLFGFLGLGTFRVLSTSLMHFGSGLDLISVSLWSTGVMSFLGGFLLTSVD